MEDPFALPFAATILALNRAVMRMRAFGMGFVLGSL